MASRFFNQPFIHKFRQRSAHSLRSRSLRGCKVVSADTNAFAFGWVMINLNA